MTPITEPSNISLPVPTLAPLPLLPPGFPPNRPQAPPSSSMDFKLPFATFKGSSSKPSSPPEQSFKKWWESKPTFNKAIHELAIMQVDLEYLDCKVGATKAKLSKAKTTLRSLHALRSRKGTIVAQSEKEFIYVCIKLKKKLSPEKWEKFKERLRAKKRKDKEERKKKWEETGVPDLTNLDRSTLVDAIRWYKSEVRKLEKSLDSTTRAAAKTAMWEATWSGKAEQANKRIKPGSLRVSRFAPVKKRPGFGYRDEPIPESPAID